REVYLDLLSHLADLHARLGQYRRAIARCYQALREERYRESLYRQLMLYCYLAGNQAEALRVYERCQDLLSQELGTEPAEETRELYRQIWQRRLPEADRVYPTPRIERHPIPYPLSRTPFVGREEEFARLVQYLERARLGKGSVVLIAGEAGVGKTRLASEFTGYARRTARVSILQGFCQELEIKLAYQPLIEALRGGLAELAPEALGGTTPLWLAEVAKLVPELHEKIPDLPANPALPPEQERGRLFEGIVQFLVGLARQAPLIVLLDDLQWVDPSTCDLLHYLTPRLREQPILLLGTYRREEVDEEHPLTGLIRKSRGSFQLIELSRLSFEEVEGLLTDLAPSLNEPFRRRIYEETAGNPFFIVSILQNLFEEGALKVDERGRWVTDIDDITLNYRELMISPGIREAIRRRLSVLAEDERRFLKLAAIIGRELDPALLKRAWGGEGQGEVELVERLLETNLIVEAEGRYEFSHPKISEVAYEETSGERRQEWHRRVGEVIEELYAERLDEYYIQLAHHYYHGEDWAKALEYTLLALKGAVKSHQLKEGLKLAELGLQSVERAGEEGAAEPSLWEKRFDILAHRASIFDLLGESAKQEDDISTMLRLASRLPDLKRLIQAHQWRAEWYHAAGEYHQEIEEAERVLELTRRLKDRRGEGTALHTIWNAYNNLGEYHQALRYYEQAYPILR
ncbi:MAG: AAA family ATPase, partial [Candidatus Bipolaricaulia bacterium]